VVETLGVMAVIVFPSWSPWILDHAPRPLPYGRGSDRAGHSQI